MTSKMAFICCCIGTLLGCSVVPHSFTRKVLNDVVWIDMLSGAGLGNTFAIYDHHGVHCYDVDLRHGQVGAEMDISCDQNLAFVYHSIGHTFHVDDIPISVEAGTWLLGSGPVTVWLGDKLLACQFQLVVWCFADFGNEQYLITFFDNRSADGPIEMHVMKCDQIYKYPNVKTEEVSWFSVKPGMAYILKRDMMSGKFEVDEVPQ